MEWDAHCYTIVFQIKDWSKQNKFGNSFPGHMQQHHTLPYSDPQLQDDKLRITTEHTFTENRWLCLHLCVSVCACCVYSMISHLSADLHVHLQTTITNNLYNVQKKTKAGMRTERFYGYEILQDKPPPPTFALGRLMTLSHHIRVSLTGASLSF